MNIMKKLTAAILTLALTLIPLALAEGNEFPEEEGPLRGVCPERTESPEEDPEFVNAILPVPQEETEETGDPEKPEKPAEEEQAKEDEQLMEGGQDEQPGEPDEEPAVSIDEIFKRRIDLTDQFAPEEPEEKGQDEEEQTEEDELAKAIREIMEQRVDLTDQPGSDTGLEKTELEDIIRTLLGYAVPIGFTIDTIGKCQNGRYTSDQKVVKVAAALTLDVIKSALPKGIAGTVNSSAQDYIDDLIKSGAFKGGSTNRNVEYVLAAVESVVGSVSADTANLIRSIYGKVEFLFG